MLASPVSVPEGPFFYRKNHPSQGGFSRQINQFLIIDDFRDSAVKRDGQRCQDAQPSIVYVLSILFIGLNGTNIHSALLGKL